MQCDDRGRDFPSHGKRQFRLTIAASHDCNTLGATKEGLFSDGRVVSNLAWLYDRFDACASCKSVRSIQLGIGHRDDYGAHGFRSLFDSRLCGPPRGIANAAENGSVLALKDLHCPAQMRW